jgi:hypothetical protein
MALEFCLVTHHRIVDVFGDLLERFGLVMMRVGVDDQEVLIFAIDRLIGGVAQQRAGVEFFAGGNRGSPCLARNWDRSA